jgi:hypothetical protein
VFVDTMPQDTTRHDDNADMSAEAKSTGAQGEKGMSVSKEGYERYEPRGDSTTITRQDRTGSHKQVTHLCALRCAA